MPDTVLYYLIVSEQQAGPYTVGQLRSMWQAGLVTAQTQYWSEGADSWRPLLDLAAILDPVQRTDCASGQGVSEPRIPTVTVRLQSVDQKKLYKLLKPYRAILSFVTSEDFVTIRFNSEGTKENLITILKWKFRSIELDERTPEHMPPALDWQLPRVCPNCKSRRTHLEAVDSVGEGFIGGLLLGGLAGGLLGAGLGSGCNKHILVCQQCGQRTQL